MHLYRRNPVILTKQIHNGTTNTINIYFSMSDITFDNNYGNVIFNINTKTNNIL